MMLRSKLFVLLCCLSLIFLSYSHIVVGFSNQMGLVFNLGFRMVIGYALFYLSYLFISIETKITKIVWSILLLGIYIVILFLLKTNSIIDSIRVFGLLLWVFCFYYGSRISRCSEFIKKYFSKTIFIGIVVLLLYYFYYYLFMGFLDNQKSNDTVFFLIVYLPFLFLFDGNKILKTITIVLFSVICLFSLKRSIVLGLVLFLFFLYLLEGNKKVVKKWYFWLILVLVIWVGIYVNNTVGNLLLSRFNETESGGSGREAIYTIVLRHFSNSSFSELILGHGFMSTLKIIGALAHNDFLQLLYDGGLIAIVFYLSMWIYFLSFAIKNWHSRKQIGIYYSIYVSTLVLLIVLSMLNCFIYSYMLLSPLMLAIGFLIGEIRNKKRLLSTSK